MDKKLCGNENFARMNILLQGENTYVKGRTLFPKFSIEEVQKWT
jgi:hypothetical protein